MSESTQFVQPRRAVLKMPEYHPPLAKRDALRLDFNENTIGCSPKVVEFLRSRIGAEPIAVYPEYAIDGLSTGEYVVYFFEVGGGGETSYFDGALGPGEATKVKVTPGATRTSWRSCSAVARRR